MFVRYAILLAVACMPATTFAGDMMDELRAAKGYALEVVSGQAINPMTEGLATASGQPGFVPDEGFLAAADVLKIAVAADDSGYLEVRGQAVGYRVEIQDDGAILLGLAYAREGTADQSSFQTELLVDPGQWLVVEELQQQEVSLAGPDTRYHYTIVRVRQL